MAERTAPQAVVSAKLNYEKLSKDKAKVLSVKDYVVVDNLWLDPAKAQAIVNRLDKEPKAFRDDLAKAAQECDKAKAAREAKPKATKAKAVAVPSLPPDAMAMFTQFMAMLQAQSATTAQAPQADVEPEPQAEPDKRESAKERADRLRERAE